MQGLWVTATLRAMHQLCEVAPTEQLSTISTKNGLEHICFRSNLAGPLRISDLDEVQDVVAQA